MKRSDPNYMREYMRKRRMCKANRLADNMRNKYYHAIKGKLPDKTCVKLFGATVKVIREHLSNKFTHDMNWGNYGKVWEVDHIKPVSRFDMSWDIEIKECFCYKNTQPMLKKDNKVKYYYY